MARETKVGLLAGLGFIICFAVILANQGRREAVTTHQSYVVDHGTRARDAAQPTARRSAAQGARPQQSGRSLRSQPPSAVDRANPRSVAIDAAQTPAASGAAVILPNQALRGRRQPSQGALAKSVPQRVTSRSPGNRANIDDASLLAAMTEPAGNPLPTSPSQSQAWAKRKRVLQHRLDTLSGRSSVRESLSQPPKRAGGSAKTIQRDQRTTRPIAASPTESPRRSRPLPARRYTVVPGDTLSKIAAVHLGSGSPAVIKAIFDANRQVILSPDVLRAGVELVLPIVQGVSRSASAGSVTAAPTHMRPTPTQPKKAGSTFRSVNTKAGKPAPHVRWYQIKKNDRYISIARQQLGDAHRWREVFELNKDKFPDPQRIREGVRIKLPLTAVRGAQP